MRSPRTGCGFDVATGEELALLQRHGVAAERIIHTHPVKKPAEIAEALAAGVRTFIVDNDVELEKFAGAPADVRLLVRLELPQPAREERSVEQVRRRAVRGGASRRAALGTAASGSRDSASTSAASSTIRADSRTRRPRRSSSWQQLETRFGVRFDTLDIGGGFPVSYDSAVASLEEVAAALRPVLEPHAGRLDIIAEPGRILVAEAMTLVTSVVGIAERGRRPLVLPRRRAVRVVLERHDRGRAPADLRRARAARRRARMPATHRWATLGGPDVRLVGRDRPRGAAARLAVGDLVVSPVMGAYTTVTATRFNGRPLTPIAVVGHGPAPPARSPRSAPGRARSSVRRCRRAGRRRRRARARCSPSRSAARRARRARA